MKQHTKPCKDCPWRRKAVRGWLGTEDAQYWLSMAHSDIVCDCHTRSEFQCAGMAIYRANVCKSAREDMLDLPPDQKAVFVGPVEFCAHHKKPVPNIMPFGLLLAERGEPTQ
jgi:hypothetical protein